MIDMNLIWSSLPALLRGAALSLQIAFSSALIGFGVGTILAAAETSPLKPLRWCVGVYVALFRGTPMLVQILFAYYVLPQFGIHIAPIWAAILAIGLNSGAYISQTIRSGISSVPAGQIEAARALGFGRVATLRHIILPQAFRVALPALGNELVTLVKDSSLASIIGVMELSKEASIIRSRTFDAFSVLLAISFMYLSMTTFLSFCLRKVEKAMRIHVCS